MITVFFKTKSWWYGFEKRLYWINCGDFMLDTTSLCLSCCFLIKTYFFIKKTQTKIWVFYLSLVEKRTGKIFWLSFFIDIFFRKRIDNWFHRRINFHSAKFFYLFRNFMIVCFRNSPCNTRLRICISTERYRIANGTFIVRRFQKAMIAGGTL